MGKGNLELNYGTGSLNLVLNAQRGKSPQIVVAAREVNVEISPVKTAIEISLGNS